MLYFSWSLWLPNKAPSYSTCNPSPLFLPPFSLLRGFSFQNTSEHFAIRFRQSCLIWEVCDVTAIDLSEGIRMAPNYPANLRWRVISWLVRSFRVVDVARILHVWQTFVKKFRHFFRINTRSVDYPIWRMVSLRLINLVPRVFSLFNMAAAREKTLAHSRSRDSNEAGDVLKMAATAKRVRRTGYEMLRWR